ncbi:MAG: glycosyltransferase [Sulfuritalea sp.]|nr:glycosyltransferase [Sulfuritalea sp.]
MKKRTINLYAMSSPWEALLLATLPAMAAGLPVIISDVSGAAEVLRDGEFGVRVPPEGIAALAKAVVPLGKNKAERRRPGAAAQHRVHEHYDLRERVARLKSVQATLLTNSVRQYWFLLDLALDHENCLRKFG